MSDPKNKWSQPSAPPAPMFFGKKERDLVKQVNDELSERIIGQPIAYYPISIEESNFNETYGEAIEKVSLSPVRVFAYVQMDNEQTNEKYGYEYQSKLTVNFHRRRLVEDQNLYVRVGDFVQYGDLFYEIVRVFNDTRHYFGQVEHKFQISAECVRARKGAFRVVPEVQREVEHEVDPTDGTPRVSPAAPVTATYITVKSESMLPNERYMAAGTDITISDTGPNGSITISADGQATGSVGAIQFQTGSGVFGSSDNLRFLADSNTLALASVLSSSMAITSSALRVENVSASAAVFTGDVQILGTLIGGSPLKISGSLSIVDPSGTELVALGSPDGGETVISASIHEGMYVSASGHVSSSYYYGDGRYLTNVTASAVSVADGPIGSLQFRFDSPIGREISGSTKVKYDIDNNRLVLNSGLVHNRNSISSSYTASSGDYILGVSDVPTQISFDATLFESGQVILIKDESGAATSADSIHLRPSGSQTIDGDSGAYIESPHGSVYMYTDGLNWFIY